MEAKQLSEDQEIEASFSIISQLRPHLKKESYLATVRRMENSDGYRLAAVFEGDLVRCVAGYRFQELLAYGKILYVDDLVTDEATRSKDFGGQMIEWLVEEARKEGCAQLQLDSGVQRHDAHRFYFREGMRISSYHFMKDL